MKRSELLLVLWLFLLPILLFWPVTLGGLTLIPADNLFAFPPWRAFAESFNASVPHNELLSDLLLENYGWKKFIVASLQQGQLPLWNPDLFTGVPFLAAGQHSALYPFSALFYLMPVEAAYGWFVALQLGIAGAAMYGLARALGIGRSGALIAGLTYQFSAFFQVSTVFPMIISAACWLPLILTCEEMIIRQLSGAAANGRKVIAWSALGALVLGVSLLAGHVEIAYYNAMVMVFFALWRIIREMRNRGGDRARWGVKAIAALGAMVGLGGALAAVQLVPLYELVSHSFRQGSVSYSDVAGWAYPSRQVVTFLIPDFFGNPSHHSYFDIFAGQTVAVTRDSGGNPIHTIFWGVKNYVEAGAYVGILPLVLALVAVYALIRSDLGAEAKQFVGLFSGLAVLSLLFAFGTPLYAILFYGLPGFNQLHSAFRWVYPYTLSVAVMAGFGAQVLSRQLDGACQNARRSLSMHVILGWLPFGCGAGLLAIIALSLVIPAPFLALAERVLRDSDLAQRAFPDARVFYSYEAVNLVRFAVFLLSAGAVVRLSRCPIYLPARLGALAVWKPLAVLVVVTDLFVFGNGFYTAIEPRLLDFTPPSVKFLQQDTGLFRIASLDAPGDKTLNPNVGMLYGLQDIRGYDSIIPKPYSEWMNLIEQQGELLYNRIAPFYWSGSLESRLLDLANVKYVITTQTLASAKFTKVYSGEVNIYRNEDVLPRAFVVERARLMKDYGSDLKGLDPAREVLLEGLAEPIPTAATACAIAPNVVIQKYSPQEVVIEAHSACDGWLVLADAYFDGWQAFDQPSGQVERETPIFRADGLFRAVRLAAGAHLVRFKYNPLSFRVGLYVSFVAAMALLLMAGYWLWGRFYREARHDREAKRVLKNSALPMGTSLLNKVIDTIFAAFMLRLLGPENAGKFAFAVVMIGYADIFINFGLSTLVTREVSRDRSQTNRYLSNTALLRVALLIVMTPLLAAVLWLWRSWFALPDDTTWAIILLALGLIPSGVSSALSSVFYAHEQMEYPAAITVVTTLIKVTVSVIVLLAGFGFVGLAGANILVNVATMIILFVLFARRFFAPRVEFDAPFARGMVRTSYPLMLNDMLSRLFFRVDVTLLQPMRGDTVVGWYTTAYRYLDGINILPSTFTIALFPVFSRYAAGAPDALMRAYRKSLKYLIILAVPLMVLSFVYAEGIILLFGGPDYLPEAAIALRLLIGFMPLSFINNVTHYVLIAVNQQRYLTKAFVIGATFNVAANLLFIPLFSYRASAIITIFSEFALLIPFYVGIRRHVGSVDWLALAWRPAAAGGVMGLLSAAFSAASPALLIPAALAVYSVTLLVLRALDDDDRDMLRLLIPARVTARWKGRADEPVP